jgi:hypothetical protein
MDVIITFALIAFVVLFPILSSICLAAVAMSVLRSHQIILGRWISVPIFLIAFSLACCCVTAWTLSYSPETKPGWLNPILVILVLEGVCILPIALLTLISGFVALHAARIEAAIDFAAVILYGLLYLPYIALHDYYPHT